MGASDKVRELGMEIYKGLPAEERMKLGSKSDTVELKWMLGTKSQPIQRHKDHGITVPSYATVGMVLKFHERTEIPVLPIRPLAVIKSSGFAPNEIQSRWVEAGEEVAMSTYEWMYLVCRPEYCGKIKGVGMHDYLNLQVIFSKFMSGESQIPTPTPTYKVGSPSEDMDTIDEKGMNGEWVVKPEYERFAGIHMSKSKMPIRSATSVDAAKITALALHKILDELQRKDATELG